MEKPRTIHDFGGFPKALFDFQYPAAGEPQLAQRVRKLLEPLDAGLDEAWGLDHGTWSVLAHVFPNADVPVVQLSMDATKPPSFHYELGRRLAPLRDEGVLIFGSGNVVHNLRTIKREDDAPAYEWAVRFEAHVKSAIERREHAALVDYEAMGEDARLAAPTPEHYLPLLYILALQGDEPASFPVDGIQNASISMLSVVVGAT
jgi:4,5-DOPA dioxygenase extradiol